MARKQPNMSEKLAACLLQLLEFKDGKFLPIIDRMWAKGKTPAEIIACFECDHYPISVFMGGGNHPTNLQWLTNDEHLKKTNSLDRETHNKLRRNAKKKAKSPTLRLADEKTNFTVADVKVIDAFLEKNAVDEPYDPLVKESEKVTASCGCVFKDLKTPCRDPDCTICTEDKRDEARHAAKIALTDRQKAYRKAVYEKRKLARKKPHGWSKKKW